MKHTIAILIAAAEIVGIASPAIAQTRYYARERVAVATAAPQTSKAGTTCDVTSQNRYPNSAGMNAGQLLTIVDVNTTPMTPALVKATCEASKTGVGTCWAIPYGTSKPSLHEIYWSPGSWPLQSGSARGSLAFAGACAA